MADDTDDVFDFSNLEFTHEDLVTTLNDMVHKYKKLSQSFEEVKAEKETCATKFELVSSSEMQAALSKLATENDELRIRSQEMHNENQRLAEIISSWTKSSASLDKLQGAMKPSNDRSDWAMVAMTEQRPVNLLKSAGEVFVTQNLNFYVVKAELTAGLTAELTAELSAELDAEWTAELSAELTAELSAELTVQKLV
ncbi:two-component sensor histidine kinase bacteria [Dorcoceras hygrometricum]|uniref:Two-component sensor histidine kinase bacteria n=1 Tax=Dorcoceras hygrometricum TaxID=472368 RepID=A0A2Z7AGE2_9LAMI|nr:two-component sensor histidine kinase bacteria [Dorcoceras hygrometricum]